MAPGDRERVSGGGTPRDEESDEPALVERSRAGSDEAFSRIVQLHQGRVRAYLRTFLSDREVVDDLAQDVFLGAYRSLGSYRGDAPLAHWLLGIARHRALMYLRDEVRRRSSGAEQAAWLIWRVAELESPAGDPARHEREMRALRACLDALPPQSAELIAEHYFGARSAAEIARTTGRKEGAVRMTLLRIRQALRQCVEGRLSSGAA